MILGKEMQTSNPDREQSLNVDDPSQGRSLSDRAIRTLLLMAVLALIGLAWLASIRDVILRFVPDDAFYYFEIARRIGSGEGSTFDGVNTTNGYHPLWLFALLPLTPLMNASRELGLRAGMMISVVLLGMALLVLYSCARRLAPAQAAWAPLFSGSVLLFSSVYGLETPLTALILSLLLWTGCQRSDQESSALGLVRGFLSGLLILSRLDCVSYALAMDIAWLVGMFRFRQPTSVGRRIKALAICAAIQAGCVGVYLLINQSFFGHPLPVSSVIKVGRSGGISSEWVHGAMPLFGMVSMGLGMLALFVGKATVGTLAIRTSAFGTMLLMILIAIKGGRETYHWYFALPALCSGLFVAVLVEEVRRRQLLRRLQPAVCGAIVLALCAFSLLRRVTIPSDFEESFDLARWLVAHSPKEARFASPDCGILGYFSERSFINTDGLTNSFDFQRAIKQDEVAEWLAGGGLSAVATRSAWPPAHLEDGTLRKQIPLRRGMYGHQREVHAILAPWNVASNSEFQLWRVVRLINGPVPVDRSSKGLTLE